MEFNYAKFLFDNGIIGTTVGTLLGFATKNLFDTFREEYFEPLLKKFFELIYSNSIIPNTKMLSIFIEYIAIILLIYIIARFILYPLMKKHFDQKKVDKINSRKHMRKIVDSLDDIEKIL